MARIFISYASEDRERARKLAADLEALGWTVWWDRKLQAGKSFAGVIESEIKRADCVLVLWSQASIASRWVRDEATEGLERGVLVPALIETVAPPLGFRSIHAADLVSYQGDEASPGFRQLVADLKALLGTERAPTTVRTPVPPPPGPPDGRRKWLRRLGPVALGLALVGIGAYALTQYLGGADRRAAELEARQKAFDEARRRTDADAAKRQAELDAKERSLAEQARAAEAEAARRAAEEEKRRAAAAEAERVRAAEADRARAAEAARKAEEAKRLAQKAQPTPAPKPAPPPTVQPVPPVAKAPPAAPAPEATKPPVPEPATPKPATAARSPLLPAPDDTWTYRYVDGFRRAEVARLTYRVDAVGETGIGESLRVSNRPDYQSRIVVAREPRFTGHGGLDYAPPDLAPYLQAFYRLDGSAPLPAVKRQLSSDAEVTLSMRVVGRERVTVPAGTFDAIKVEAEGRGSTFINRYAVHAIVTLWYVPEVKRFVKYDARWFERNLPQEIATFELVEYRVAR